MEFPEFVVHDFPSPTDSISGEPFLFSDESNRIHLSWIEKKNDSSYLNYAVLENDTWTASTTIASGNSWFVNWADYPVIASNGKNKMAHYLDKSGDGTYAYDVKVVLSSDQGKTWSKSFTLHDDGKQAEHGFVSIVPFQNNFFVSWLDGRNTRMANDMNHKGHEAHQGAMSVRAAVLDGSGKKVSEWELDNKVCDCCQTSSAITSNGPIVVYRDRSEEEIRDISIVRLVDGVWTEPKTIYNDNWEIKGCPVNGPRVVANGNNLAIAWFSAADNKPQVQIIFSTDGGDTFHEPIRIDHGKAIGRVDVEWRNDEQVLASWMEGGEIRLIAVNKNGTKGESMVVATSSEGRASGFPQMALYKDEVFIAWTSAEEKKIKMVSVSLK
ncbi:MAG: exo-alpha-sialidase [Flammeovirgaceae bacterium]|nr:exo-alpha-sialidase [Flammeovirgaceae bacterium]